MKLVLLFGFLVLPMLAKAEGSLKRYLYMSTPDASQAGGSGQGILVFDIDDGHRFVRRIELPFAEGLRGFCGNLKRHALYFSSMKKRLGAFDLETEKILWDREYEMGIDRACITPDGSKLYAPTGFWFGEPASGLLMVTPENGDIIKPIPAGPLAHNSIASLNGQFVFLGTKTAFHIFRAADGSLVRTVDEVGEKGVFPFTVDSRNRLAYICLGGHIGFDVVDIASGKALHRVLAGPEPIAHRTHGAALTPDESELWISDQQGQKLFYFDATVQPPKQKGFVELSMAGHGWVCFSMDGRFGWCHTPDVFDAHSHKQIATLKDENGRVVCGSKFIEVHLRDGKVVAMGDQFGLGRAASRSSQ
ncbi:MAG: hypothetical protein K8R87_12225 [Verrucomicrobia bacterium]|nr:hypothetical protein [Verrucomicrobiota bacterium]